MHRPCRCLAVRRGENVWAGAGRRALPREACISAAVVASRPYFDCRQDGMLPELQCRPTRVEACLLAFFQPMRLALVQRPPAAPALSARTQADAKTAMGLAMGTLQQAVQAGLRTRAKTARRAPCFAKPSARAGRQHLAALVCGGRARPLRRRARACVHALAATAATHGHPAAPPQAHVMLSHSLALDANLPRLPRTQARRGARARLGLLCLLSSLSASGSSWQRSMRTSRRRSRLERS